MSTDALERCLQILNALQEDVLGGDPRAFGEGRNLEAVWEVVEEWEAVNALADVFLRIVRDTRGIPRSES